jgi:hypothetical protein
MADTVRFSVVLRSSGTPKVYLPLADPKQDKNFMRMVRQQRVLSLKQEPTGTKKDFGTVGFVEEKYVSYLVFPKSLIEFVGKRIVGVKYDTLRQADVTIPHVVLAKKQPVESPRAAFTRRIVKFPAMAKPKPGPRLFTTTIRVTAIQELEVTVEARNKKEAGIKAAEAARSQSDLSFAKVETKVVRIEKTKTNDD